MSPAEIQKSGEWFIKNGVAGFDLNSLPRCNAITKTTNRPCRNPAMKGRDVCCVHAGLKHPGAKKGNKNAFKHGLYTAETIAAKDATKRFLKDTDEFLNNILGKF